MYIGKTKHSLAKRMKGHYNDTRKEAENGEFVGIFHIAIHKYGEDSFEWTILEDNIDDNDLNDREKYWIAHYNTYKNKAHYNLTPGGDGGECDDYVKEKIRKKNTGRKWTQEQRDNFSRVVTGRKHAPETIQKMKDVPRTEEWCGKISSSLKGKTKSEEHRRKLSAIQTKHMKLIAENESETLIFETYDEAWQEMRRRGLSRAKTYGGFCSTIRGMLRGEMDYAYSFKWRVEELSVEAIENTSEDGSE